jgi:sugar/nucleoside kinase (ribokinase family)
MSDPRVDTAARLEQVSKQAAGLNTFVGLDGFVDEIFHVVDKRENATSYTRLPTIEQYASRLAEAAGKSTNIELVSQRVKLGGNGPIMANALASFGLKVSYLGNLGYPHLHPIFEEFSRKAEVHSIAEPGFTDALEFEDGKVMVGKHVSLGEVNWNNILSRFGAGKLQTSLSSASLVCFVNWTMYTATSDIWEAIQREIAPTLNGERRLLFIDLADPEKRTERDIRHALDLIGKFQSYFEVILGLNEKESTQIADALKLEVSDRSPAGLARLAGQIRDTLGVNTVVIHPVKFAVTADAQGTAEATSAFTPKPLITTGAGDHFNAGFCLGRSLGLTNEQSLWAGVTTSGFYVRQGKSPDIADLVAMLRNWPEEQTGTGR